MSSKFRIGEKEYRLPKPRISSGEKEAIKKLSEELEVARAEGKYSSQALNVASTLPRKAFPIVADYIKEHDRKIYGGTALNMYLPREHKIYKRSTLPDYDFFSPEPWVDAVKIADLLYNAGFKYTETKAGIHKGTFKIFADFWPVADITYLPPDVYSLVTTTKKNGYTIVSPAYLQMTLYNIISKPIEAPVRWPNVAFRQKLLETWSPPKYRKKQCVKDFIGKKDRPELDNDLENALHIVYTEAKKDKLIHYGALAYNKYIELGGGELRLPVYYYELLAEDAGEHAAHMEKEISKITNKKLVRDIFYQPYKDMNRLSFVLYLNSNDELLPIFVITELTRCIPYKYLGNRYYCSIDYLFYELYNQMFSDIHLYTADVSCLIRYLYYIQQRYYKQHKITELDKSPLQRFVTKCRGPYVDVVREEFYSRWVDRARTQTETVDILPEADSVTLKGVASRKIRVYPPDYIDPEECRDLPKDTCVYPCNWVDELQKCSGIPVTGYQPGKPEAIRVTDQKVINLKK